MSHFLSELARFAFRRRRLVDPVSTTERQAYDLTTEGFGAGFNRPARHVPDPDIEGHRLTLRLAEARPAPQSTVPRLTMTEKD